ncbi:MAG: hypothetical protein FJZ01_05690 [Candidatus Sericytochromatia bacterium]|nr:hypothetical protein [Candidatus Tanganyikabacteria bacterium]
MLGEWQSGSIVEMEAAHGLREVGDVFAVLDFSIAVRLREPSRLAAGAIVSLVAWDDEGAMRRRTGEILQVHGRFVAVAIVLGLPRPPTEEPSPSRPAGPGLWMPAGGGPAVARIRRPDPEWQPLHQSRLEYWLGRRLIGW